jgi:FtsH-binding integral membrane protein
VSPQPVAESAAAPQTGARSKPPDGRLPIVIGVTGHRHLRPTDLPRHREHIRGLFTNLRRRYPSTPLRIVTALAEGADRLVAEVALEDGHEVLVPLPLEPADYEHDFPATAAEFYSILRRVPPEEVFVLPRDDAADAVRPTPPEQREKRYRAAGMFLAQQSHLLLALWDGRPTESTSGTAAVVRMKLDGPSGLPEAGLRPLDAEDGGPVYHIHALRAGEPESHPAKNPEWMFPQEGDEALFHTLCGRIERFNSEPLRRSLAASLPDAARALLPDIDSRSAGGRTLAAAFAAADLLARHYQRITRVVLRLTLLFAALLALIFEIYAEILPSRALPAAYLVLFASLTLILLWQGRRDVQGRYLDYRALAEGLRVQFYWRLAGLHDSASSSYLRKQADELRWIREALRAAAALPPPDTAHPELAIQHWVGGQAAYYADRAHSQRQRLHHFERRSRNFLGAGLVATAVLVVFWGLLEHLPTWHRWIVVLMGFAPIGAALWETYAERLGLRTQVNQYARFAGIFRRAGRFAERLERHPGRHDRHHALIALLRELGREALMENGDWVLLLRERPIVLPKG